MAGRFWVQVGESGASVQGGRAASSVTSSIFPSWTQLAEARAPGVAPSLPPRCNTCSTVDARTAQIAPKSAPCKVRCHSQ